MPKVVMYSTLFCPYCMRAKALLDSKGVDYEERRIEGDQALMQEMIQRAKGRTSVPQIFIDEYHVGGYDDMAALDRAGKLDPLLEAPARHATA